MEEYKALEVFEQLATPLQWSTHLVLKSKMKLYGTKSKNYLASTKRVKYDLPPKFISNIDFTFKIDESIFNEDEAQALYNQMRHITKEYRIQAMSLYVQSTNRECEILTDEIKHIIEGFPRNTEENDEQVDAESGPRFIYNDPKTASRRRATELAILKRKIELRFFEKKVSPGQSVEFFIAELNIILQKLHDTSITSTHRQKKQQHKLFLSDNPLANTQSSQSQNINSSSSFRNEKKKNYGRLVKRLKHKIRSPTHLYYLPKTHKPGTPLRLIFSGLQHPTIKISTYIGELLRPLFDKIALKTTTTSGFEVMKQVYEWSTNNLRKETLLCIIDVVNLYTMIPQTEGVLAIKKMLDYLELKQIGGLKIETIIKLSRFVMKNNYFFI
ncbi:unnamed protein product [Rotaria magnacalcarata]|uniref:Reverse transcriptase domain-containing protein n=1 Tax=Rotaria magnacalcarata TaxID=392030 RepID=A0A819IE79_9BILA|nr:unnamed protein product [Rotaria magnacalcarata]